MISVSDILKLLDQIPIWKAIFRLPKRVAELERIVGELQEKSASTSIVKAPPGRERPLLRRDDESVEGISAPAFQFCWDKGSLYGMPRMRQ
jgi:hypothetical protein